MSARRTAPLLALLAIAGVAALFYGPRPAASQVGTGISQQERDTANGILATDAARYLSGDGLHALLMLSGKGPNTAFSLSGSSLPTSIDEDEAASVLVNNPAEDTLAIDDISSQSETAVAGFGSTIVVTFNDSFGFVFPNHSGMGFNRSTDGARPSQTWVICRSLQPATMRGIPDWWSTVRAISMPPVSPLTVHFRLPSNSPLESLSRLMVGLLSVFRYICRLPAFYPTVCRTSPSLPWIPPRRLLAATST